MRVCLVTTGQPSTNPRLVKEADACASAGWDVHVVAAHWADWATTFDRDLLASRPWRCTFVDWRRDQDPVLFWKSRVRHWLARRAAPYTRTPGIQAAALSRVGLELARAARRVRADLYIAHNLGALPAAATAAAAHGALLGFDAEDFHSGQFTAGGTSHQEQTVRAIEQAYLPSCAYVTAASDGIAAAYHASYGIALPTTVLNVFPRADRPAALRVSDPGDPLRLYWFSQTIGADRGLEEAVAAIGLLGDARVELHLRGAWQPGFEGRLRDLAARTGVRPGQLVVLPPASAADMVRAAAQFDVGLALEPGVTTNNDIAVSNKIFTYLLAGLAVVMTRTSGQAALLPVLGDAAAGCAVRDAASLADALRPWLDDRQALQRARRTAWQRAEEQFNWDIEQQRFLAVVQRVLDRRRSGVRGESAA